MSETSVVNLRDGDTFLWQNQVYMRTEDKEHDTDDKVSVLCLASKVNNRWVKLEPPRREAFNAYCLVERVVMREEITVSIVV